MTQTMAGLKEIALEVRARWVSQKLQVSEATPQGLDLFSRWELESPAPAYADFFRVAGVPNDCDREGFRFWGPDELRLTGEVLRRDPRRTGNFDTNSLIIADYLQECWWYCLWISGRYAGRVSIVLGDEHAGTIRAPRWSLEGFLRAYLADDPSLYPHGPADTWPE